MNLLANETTNYALSKTLVPSCDGYGACKTIYLLDSSGPGIHFFGLYINLHRVFMTAYIVIINNQK
jgi:hypothetical protein